MANLTVPPHALDAKAKTCRAIIECSRGARCKYAYDPELEAFTLKRLLPAGMSFPLDFGFVPATQAEDGETKRNDRLLGVAQASLSYAAIKAVVDLAPGFLDAITSFWTQYETLRAVGFKILGVKGAAEAVNRIKATSSASRKAR